MTWRPYQPGHGSGWTFGSCPKPALTRAELDSIFKWMGRAYRSSSAQEARDRAREQAIWLETAIRTGFFTLPVFVASFGVLDGLRAVVVWVRRGFVQ